MTAHENNIEQKLQQLAQALESQDSIIPGVMSRIEALPKGRPGKHDNQKSILMIRRIIMNRFTKFAAAAVIIISVVLAIGVWNKSMPAAYALECTIRANHGVRYIHIKDFKPGQSDPKEFWIEFSESGEVMNARLDFPAWASADGEKAVVWKEDKAKVWFKKKNTLTTLMDKTVATQLLEAMQQLNPRLAVERLKLQQAEGKASVEIDEPADKSKPIVVTATYPPQGSIPGRRLILFVDPATKLVSVVEFYQLKDGEYRQYGLTEYHGYNQPIDPAVFALENEVPTDAMRVDQTTQEIGLVQGRLTDQEIAVEVVCQFLQALIAADYAKAGRIYSGVPAELLEQKLAAVKFVRIVSIGEPTPSTFNDSLKVPCEYEIEADGVKSVSQSGIYVRPVHGQPGRWSIDGGF
ncbi:MAG: hypothetical protein JXN61_10405 [Sedimentisphaerales bacterium]|nr:hypothetical protein [Sedimentisphaerales bacterium]